MAKKEINIPFPAWTSIFEAEDILSAMREHPSFRRLPSFRTPKKVIFNGKSGELEQKIKYWLPGGSYLNVKISGEEVPGYGIQWKIKNLRVRWRTSLADAEGEIIADSQVNADVFLGRRGLVVVRNVLAARSNLDCARKMNSKISPNIKEGELFLKNAKNELLSLLEKLAPIDLGGFLRRLPVDSEFFNTDIKKEVGLGRIWNYFAEIFALKGAAKVDPYGYLWITPYQDTKMEKTFYKLIPQ